MFFKCLRAYFTCLTLLALTLGSLPGHAQNGAFQNDQTHRFLSGDLIKIAVDHDALISGIYQIETQGTINLPLIGSQVISGQTASQIADQLTQKLKHGGFFNDPSVSVQSWHFKAVKRDCPETPSPPPAVIQECKPVPLPANAHKADDFAPTCGAEQSFYILGAVNKPGRYPFPEDGVHFLGAIAIAGGFNTHADQHGFDLIRKVDGAYFKGQYDSSTYGLQPGDIIVVTQKAEK